MINAAQLETDVGLVSEMEHRLKAKCVAGCVDGGVMVD